MPPFVFTYELAANGRTLVGGDILAKVVEKALKGAEILYTLQLPSGNRLLSLFPSHRNHALGEEVRVRIDAQHLICFPHQG